MARLTREELVARQAQRRVEQRSRAAAGRGLEFVLLVVAAIVVATALGLVYAAKVQDVRANSADTIDLNALTGLQQLIPLLAPLPTDADQSFVANRVYNLVRHGDTFANVGTLARLRVTEAEAARAKSATALQARMNEARQRRDRRFQELEAGRGFFASRWARWTGKDQPAEVAIPLITTGQLAYMKPHLRVREFGAYVRQLIIWSVLFVVAFFAVHLFWRVRGFTGDQVLLPAVMVLSGIGLALMISLRDPLRDSLMFRDFAQGAVAGCIVLALLSIPDYERRFGRLSFVPLAGAVVLAVLLGLFGTGPGVSDAKVNLFFFQPVELIRILLVMFLAGYFAQNWDALRQLRHDRELLPAWARRLNVPRLDYVLPVLFGVGLSLVLFFWLSDLGPALVIACLFLTMYSLGRNRVALAAGGLALVILGFAGGYAIGYPRTVRDRVSMWLSPWDNGVRGGDQVAHSLWSLSTGGATGTGLGLGDSELMPAAHTDLILSAAGEQAGFVGLLAIFALYGVLVYRGVRIALRARGTYSYFLAVGLTLITAYQLLLITGGLLDLIPLSGVVSPFLSYGRTSMVANFALIAMLLAISDRSRGAAPQSAFEGGSRVMLTVLGALLLVVVGRFAWVQIARADDTLIRGSLTMQADGVRRYQYNPRLMAIARELPKGTIFDRNGLPLATSDMAAIEAHRAEYEKLGIRLDQTVSKLDRRQYPLGAPMFYLLGDVRTRLKQGASNTAFQESASRIRLQGYDDVAEIEEGRDPVTGQVTARVRRDYRELIPLLRHRYEPNNPAVKELRERPRDVHMSIDARLQLRASDILRRNLTKLGKQRGAVVIMDPATGDLLASVSYPWPTQEQFSALKANPQTPVQSEDYLDRARFGLYPPGSSFKIVTAIAALRKDPALAQKRYDCVRLPDGRVGAVVGRRTIRDDVKDVQPHGSVDMQKGIVVSCNAYFAQLGTDSVGSAALYDTASKLGISVAAPNTAEQLRQHIAQASYGQGQVVASPFQMARVAATVANGGNAPQGRWVVDETNPRVRQPIELLAPSLANQIGGYMRGVVTSGTGRAAASATVPIAGKTGTAELQNASSHAWFIGFAPYGAQSGEGKRIAFSVLVENGQYGGTAAAPIAAELVTAARELGIL